MENKFWRFWSLRIRIRVTIRSQHFWVITSERTNEVPNVASSSKFKMSSRYFTTFWRGLGGNNYENTFSSLSYSSKLLLTNPWNLSFATFLLKKCFIIFLNFALNNSSDLFPNLNKNILKLFLPSFLLLQYHFKLSQSYFSFISSLWKLEFARNASCPLFQHIS